MMAENLGRQDLDPPRDDEREEKGPGRRELAAARRRQIVDAALHVFGTVGLNGSSLDDVAAEAKCTRSLLMYYFPTKDALFQAVLERRDESIEEALVSLPLAATLGEEIEQLLLLMFDHARQNKGIYTVLVSRSLFDESVSERVRRLTTERRSLIVERLRRHQEAGRLSSVMKVPMVAETIQAYGVHFSVTCHLLEREDPEVTRRRILETARSLGRLLSSK